MRRILLVVLTVAVTVGLAGAPASAQTKVRKDKIGDAPVRADIRSVKLQNNGSKLAYTVRLTHLSKRRSHVDASITPPSTQDGFSVTSGRDARGRYVSTLASVEVVETPDSVDATFTDVPCAGLRTKVRGGRKGYVRVVIPQSCLGAVAGRIQLNVAAFDLEGPAERARVDVAAARRGDEPSGLPFDFLGSPITTRRG